MIVQFPDRAHHHEPDETRSLVLVLLHAKRTAKAVHALDHALLRVAETAQQAVPRAHPHDERPAAHILDPALPDQSVAGAQATNPNHHHLGDAARLQREGGTRAVQNLLDRLLLAELLLRKIQKPMSKMISLISILVEGTLLLAVGLDKEGRELATLCSAALRAIALDCKTNEKLNHNVPFVILLSHESSSQRPFAVLSCLLYAAIHRVAKKKRYLHAKADFRSRSYPTGYVA